MFKNNFSANRFELFETNPIRCWVDKYLMNSYSEQTRSVGMTRILFCASACALLLSAILCEKWTQNLLKNVLKKNANAKFRSVCTDLIQSSHNALGVEVTAIQTIHSSSKQWLFRLMLSGCNFMGKQFFWIEIWICFVKNDVISIRRASNQSTAYQFWDEILQHEQI